MFITTVYCCANVSVYAGVGVVELQDCVGTCVHWQMSPWLDPLQDGV